MANSIRELVLADLVTALEAITTANGYDIQVAQVFREPPNPETVVSLPAILVEESNEEILEEPLGKWLKTLTIDLRCVVESQTQTSKEVNALIASVEKAVMVDPQRSLKAIDTMLAGNQKYVHEDLLPRALAVVQVRIRYRHELQDPYTL